MIPKIIHYCRYGQDKPELVKRCIASWNFFCPGYDIIEWNETNCDFKYNAWVRGASKHKKRAFVADYFRLKALYEYGGIYIDADTEMIKNIDDVLENDGFMGFHFRSQLCLGFIGCHKNNVHIKNIIDIYEKMNFSLTNHQLINDIVTNYFRNIGLEINGKEQEVGGFMFYSANKVSIDLGDGNAFVSDYHMNSWVGGNKINHKPMIYLEYLASQDSFFAGMFDAYTGSLKSTLTWKIGNTIVRRILEPLYKAFSLSFKR